MSRFFLPFLAVKQSKYFPICIVNNYFFGRPKLNVNGPFFWIENDNSVISFFLEAIFNSTVEEAKKFVSDDFESICDLYTVKRFLTKDFSYKNCNYKYVTAKNFGYGSKNFFVKPVVFVEKNGGKGNIIDFYLVRQPDNFSQWKICGIE